MKEDSMKHGAFGWTELMTMDHEAAKTFYTSLFGWETEAYPMERMQYTGVNVGDEPVGGIMSMPLAASDMPPTWSAYVTVDDMDATAATVETLGGIILRSRWTSPMLAGSACFRTHRMGRLAPLRM